MVSGACDERLTNKDLHQCSTSGARVGERWHGAEHGLPLALFWSFGAGLNDLDSFHSSPPSKGRTDDGGHAACAFDRACARCGRCYLRSILPIRLQRCFTLATRLYQSSSKLQSCVDGRGARTSSSLSAQCVCGSSTTLGAGFVGCSRQNGRLQVISLALTAPATLTTTALFSSNFPKTVGDVWGCRL